MIAPVRLLPFIAALAAGPAIAAAADQPQAQTSKTPPAADQQWQGCPGYGQGAGPRGGRGMMGGQGGPGMMGQGGRGQGMMSDQHRARMQQHMRGQNMPCQQGPNAAQTGPQPAPKAGQ